MPDKTFDLSKPNRWSPDAVKALIERLYETRRRANAIGIQNPVFVLPCRDDAARHDLEDAIYKHFIRLYGNNFSSHFRNEIAQGDDTIIHFSYGVSIALMKV